MILFNNTNMRTAMAYTNAVGDKVYPVIVDIKKGIKSTEEILFVSSDINTGILSVAFIQGNDTYNVAGAEVVCSIMRPDASTLDIPCTVIENNIVEVPLGVNGTSQDGIYSFDFKVFKSGNKVVGTPTMNYSVSLSISNDNAVLEDDRLPVLTVLMTQLTEIKDEAREAINQANTATEATKVATTNAIEATNNVNAVINTANQKMVEVDNAKNEMTATVTNKVNEVEGRFNALTASQQQDAEVIDARDGETSLKARLDRDIEKANKELDKIKKLEESTVSTVETESDFTTVEATNNGYFEDVKLEGKTLVNIAKRSQIKKTTPIGDCHIGDFGTHSDYPIDVNKEYTLIVNVIKNTSDGSLFINNTGVINDLVFDNITNVKDGLNVFKVKTRNGKPITNTSYWGTLGIRGATVEGEVEASVIILEGDHTQNPPSYFEGLKSVGQDVDKIEVLSCNENLFNMNWFKVREGAIINNDSVTLTAFYDDKFISDRIKFDSSKKYAFTRTNTSPTNNSLGFIIKYTDGTRTQTLHQGKQTIYNDTTKTIESVGFTFTNHEEVTWTDVQIKIVDNSDIVEYTPHQADKKRLLYYNEETQSWEKPILREWDSIEKHADGKYYYYQRSGEVVLNGSENWGIYNTTVNNTFSAKLPILDNMLPHVDICICDSFRALSRHDNIWENDLEGISITQTALAIRIDKTKLSTQDVAGFKKWLQTNNVTVVYQLAQEKVYECTNIDLITYANETNYIVECGAIAPKSKLKVHNNISNVVKILQEKVSLLENKFIEGLKKVLAGDMYSLAELLYPEDFEEENPENNIMLLPLE